MKGMSVRNVRKSTEKDGCYSRVALHIHLITKTTALLRSSGGGGVRGWGLLESDESSLVNHIFDKWARA